MSYVNVKVKVKVKVECKIQSLLRLTIPYIHTMSYINFCRVVLSLFAWTDRHKENNTCFAQTRATPSNEGRPLTDTLFCSGDLDLDLEPMTLIYKPDLDILKVYLLTRNELSRSRLSKLKALQTDRQTEATGNTSTLHLRVVKTHTRTHSSLFVRYCSHQSETLKHNGDIVAVKWSFDVLLSNRRHSVLCNVTYTARHMHKSSYSRPLISKGSCRPAAHLQHPSCIHVTPPFDSLVIGTRVATHRLSVIC